MKEANDRQLVGQTQCLFSENMTKCELLQVALDDLSTKCYVVDEVAAKHNVQILW